MRQATVFAGFLPIFLAVCLPAAGQLSPSVPDPLARIREAAKGSTQACSTTAESLCEQVAPKIIANAQGDSPLADNLRRLNNEFTGSGGSEAAARLVAWAVAGFRDAGFDVHPEEYSKRNGSPTAGKNVVAEIRGRETPDEWVLVASHFQGGFPDENCNTGMVIEAARDILRTGIRPRRSIRFVVFTDDEKDMPGSWGYVRAHRGELDRARAAIILDMGCSRMAGYLLNGRRDIESGLREAIKPIESLNASQVDYSVRLRNGNFDFFSEGVPTLSPIRTETLTHDLESSERASGNFDLAEVKRNTAIVAVTAFGIAELPVPLGPRQSRMEIENLLKTEGLEPEMRTAGLWSLWESGERGRLR